MTNPSHLDPSLDPTSQHGPRQDLASAIAQTPPAVQRDLNAAGQQAVDLLERFLPQTERVLAVCSAAVQGFDAPMNSVLVLTDRRVLFVAPKPQVISCSLLTVRSLSTMNKVFFLKADGDYQLGADPAWSGTFADLATRAVAEAVLVHG